MASPTQSAGQPAAAGAATILSQDVLKRTRARLGSDRTVSQLRDQIATTVDASRALVAVEATSQELQLATTIATEVPPPIP